MTWYTWAWVAWIIFFVVIEGIALRDRRKGDTLSEHVWKWFGVGQKGWWALVRRTALLVGCAVLMKHFLAKGWF